MKQRALTPTQALLIEVLRTHGAHLINSRVTGVRFSTKAAHVAWRGVPVQRKTIAALVAAGKLAPTSVNAMRQEFRLTESA